MLCARLLDQVRTQVPFVLTGTSVVHTFLTVCAVPLISLYSFAPHLQRSVSQGLSADAPLPTRSFYTVLPYFIIFYHLYEKAFSVVTQLCGSHIFRKVNRSLPDAKPPLLLKQEIFLCCVRAYFMFQVCLSGNLRAAVPAENIPPRAERPSRRGKHKNQHYGKDDRH